MAPDKPSPGGTFSEHDPLDEVPVLVAPTTDKAFNTIRPPLAPLACWRLEDLRFEFDSSFVKADAEPELSLLAAAYQRMGQPALSVFGHADPTGDDEYNKLLSGRRAQAVYGLLTRNMDLWEDLYSHPLGGDNWQNFAVQRMQTRLGQSGGASGAQARKTLYQQYMDAICHDSSGAPFSVAAAGFLGQGQDSGGKADYQGCSRFNPVMVFSTSETVQLQNNTTERDRQNASNRRVLVFLFPPGLAITPSAWPCPRAKEASAGCRGMFWPDGDTRRFPKSNHREYAKDKDTFACAFYDGMARSSPCEGVRKRLEMRLFDGIAKAIPNAPYRVTVGSHDSRDGKADVDGKLVEDELLAGAKVLVEWGFDDQSGVMPFSLEVALDFDRGAGDDGIVKRLANLGYLLDDLSANVKLFKHDYGLTPEDGDLDAATRQAITDVHDKRLSKAEFQAQRGAGNG